MPAAPSPLLAPAFALVGLTAIVWIWMYVTRTLPVLKGTLRVGDFGDPATAYPARLRWATDNFSNLFELPVLFYAWTLFAHQAGVAGDTELALAWIFVGSRYVHSAIHCGVNHVLARLLTYLLGALALWALWIRLGLAVFAGGA